MVGPNSGRLVVALDRLLEPAQLAQHDPEIARSIGMVRVEGQHGAVEIHGFLSLAGARQRIRQIERRLGIARPQVQGAHEGLDGLFHLAGVEQHGTEIIVEIRHLAVEVDGLANEGCGGGRAPRLTFQHAEQMQRVGVLRLGGEDAAIDRLGFGEAAGLMMRQRSLERAHGATAPDRPVSALSSARPRSGKLAAT